jgi:peptide/nickel transport system ATP-binding protein
MTAAPPLLDLDGLTVRFGAQAIVDDVSLCLRPGEVLGLVGESGSGKTTVALALLGHRPWGASVTGHARLGGQDVLSLPDAALRRLRGRKIAYVPQNPTTALNPVRRIGALMAEQLLVHAAVADRDAAHARAADALRDVGLPEAERTLARYPHELSGGQQQRVVLALATLCSPDVLVLDEPTTGLDLATQAVVIGHLRLLRDERRQAMVYVTHDLELLAGIATRLVVLYAGRVMESGPAEALFSAPRHPYTRALLSAMPSLRHPGKRLLGLPGTLERDRIGTGCPFAARCPEARADCARRRPPLAEIAPDRAAACHYLPDLDVPGTAAAVRPDPGGRAGPPILTVRDLSVTYPAAGLTARRNAPPALSAASLDLARGEILGVIGESGSGKSTLGKAIAGLLPGFHGTIALHGEPLAPGARQRSQDQRRRLQFVFQNPDASLNPRRRVGQILADALRAARPGLATAARDTAIAASLAEVRLPQDHAARYPDQLSGGERQRVALARALVAQPEILVCDEVLSALDVSVQAGIVTLLARLCRERNLAILFISHDLTVVRQLTDRVIVLYRGQILAHRPAARLLDRPLHPYLSHLLAAARGIAPRTDSATVGRGCAFFGACPVGIAGTCDTIPPPWTEGLDRFRCHLRPAQLPSDTAAADPPASLLTPRGPSPKTRAAQDR